MARLAAPSAVATSAATAQAITIDLPERTAIEIMACEMER
jgi:hypothetical protein